MLNSSILSYLTLFMQMSFGWLKNVTYELSFTNKIDR